MSGIEDRQFVRSPLARGRLAWGQLNWAQWRQGVLALAALVVVSWSPVEAVTKAGSSHGSPGSSHGKATGDVACLHPTVSIETTAGSLNVVLYRDAAPQAVTRLLGLIKDGSGGGSDSGLTGLELDFIRPYSEVRSSPLPDVADWPLEVDGAHLGLGDDVISSEGESMETIQTEFLGVHGKNKNQPPTPRFAKWIEQWRADRNPRLLMGVSRLELLESYGFKYQRGLPSRPVERGTIVMRNRDTQFAEPRLTFVLGDRPLETGKWMVVGRVVAGLETLRELSIRPLENEFAKRGRPRDPARVTGTDSICMPTRE